MKNKAISAVLLLAALLCLSAAAAATDLDDNSTIITLSNVWKDSDIRKYLNNGASSSVIDSSESNNDSGYAAHFTDAEYALMRAETVKTKKQDTNVDIVTTDRIFLPSGKYHAGNGGAVEFNILSWGEEDLGGMEPNFIRQNAAVLIPKGYWAEGSSGAWLRAAQSEGKAQIYTRGETVSSASVGTALGVAPVFRLDASAISFASAVSAADMLKGDSSAQKETVIQGNGYLGSVKKTNAAGTRIPLPDYGMYLKTAYADKDFRVRNLSYSGGKLSFEYAGGMPGDYVMIQAYEQDNFDLDVTGYAFAMLIGEMDGRGDMSVRLEGNLRENLQDYTFKVWMENPSSVNLAQATVPQTFLFDGRNFVEVKDNEAANLPKNLRMFAMKDELTCSWGDLSGLLQSFNGVLAGEVVGSTINDNKWITGKSCGVNPSNQMIYFGMDEQGKPMQFWIAGNSEGMLTLYRAKAAETHVFDDGQITVGTQPDISDLPESGSGSLMPGGGFTVTWTVLGSNTHTFVSTNPHVATVDDAGKVTIHNYGAFSLILFSGGDAVQTDTISVVNPNLPEYIPAGDWPDETQDAAQQAAADSLPQTGDSSLLPPVGGGAGGCPCGACGAQKAQRISAYSQRGAEARASFLFTQIVKSFKKDLPN